MRLETVLHTEIDRDYRARRHEELERVESRVLFADACRGRRLAFVFVRPGELCELTTHSAWDTELRAGEQCAVRVFECSGRAPFVAPRQLVSTWLVEDLLAEKRPPRLERGTYLPRLIPLVAEWEQVRAWLEEQTGRAGGALGPRQRLSTLAV